MHYLDEIVHVYPAEGTTRRRYLLSLLGALPLAADAESLLELLWKESADRQPAVAALARRELGRVLPEYLRMHHRLRPAGTGVWTDYRKPHDDSRGADALARSLAEASDLELEPFLAAAWQALACLDGIVGALGRGGRSTRCVASLVTGRMRLRKVIEALLRGVRSAPDPLQPAAALAELADPEGHEVLLDTVQRSGHENPDLIALLREVPVARTLPILEKLASRGSSTVLESVALGLPADRDGVSRGLVDTLLARDEPWVTVYALDHLRFFATGDDLPRIVRAHARVPHEFVRVRAVQAAGFVPGPDAVEFLDRIVRTGSWRERAAALESLARQRADPSRLLEPARALLSSPLLRARVNAALALAPHEDALVRPFVDGLLLSGSALERLEGAFILGHLQGPESVAVLLEILREEPDSAVRMQALKSLVKHPPDATLEGLLACLDPRFPGLATQALRAIELVGADAAPAVTERLRSRLAAGSLSSIRGALLRALGIVASDSGDPAVRELLVRHCSDEDPRVVCGALDGLKTLAGSAEFPAGMRALFGHSDPRVRGRAVVCGFLWGDLSGAGALDPLLRSDDDRTVRAGLKAALEIACLLPAFLRSPRSGPLALELESVLATEAGSAFAASQTTGTATPIPARPAAVFPRLPPPPPTFAEIQAARLATDLEARVRSDCRRRAQRAGSPDPAPALDLGEVSDLVHVPPDLAPWSARDVLGLLAAAAAVLLAFLGLFASLAPGPSQSAGSLASGPAIGARPGEFVLVAARGAVTRTRRGRPPEPARPGEILRAGDTLASASDGRFSLEDCAGNAIIGGPGSRFRLGDPATDALTAAVVACDPTGDIVFDLRKAGTAEVLAGGGRLTLRSAAVRFHDRGRETEAAVVAGDVSWTAPDGSSREAVIGEALPVVPSVSGSPATGRGAPR